MVRRAPSRVTITSVRGARRKATMASPGHRANTLAQLVFLPGRTNTSARAGRSRHPYAITGSVIHVAIAEVRVMAEPGGGARLR
jgi:hypothetical protein